MLFTTRNRLLKVPKLNERRSTGSTNNAEFFRDTPIDLHRNIESIPCNNSGTIPFSYLTSLKKLD